jgi:hypothetical protein
LLKASERENTVFTHQAVSAAPIGSMTVMREYILARET